jgi:hypothetical protein
MNVARKALATLGENASAAPIFGTNGPTAEEVSAIATANPTYVALGAIGPDIFFLLPDFKPPWGATKTGGFGLWWLATAIRDYYTAFDDMFLGPWESAMGPIGANASDEINALTGGLEQTISGIASQATHLMHDFVVMLILRQYDFFGFLSSGVPAGFDEQTFFWSDMLHYRQTYRFGAVLWQRASTEPDPDLKARFQAFALGWMTHLATDVTGHPFVNEKVGGPYRLHWQRHHLVENHMEGLVYNSDHGGQDIYQQLSNSALHLWLAFKADGSSRVNFFDSEPNPTYPDGDHSADIVGRHAVWDFDSDMPLELAQFVSDSLKAVFWPNSTPPPSPFQPQTPIAPVNAGPTSMMACCPTIISTLAGRVPIATGGFADTDDIQGAYWWLYHYVKWTTTDYYKIRRPDPPDVFVIPSWPSMPGSGDSDPGPILGGFDNPIGGDVVDEFLLLLLAWLAFLAECIVWPVAAIAGILAGTATYTLREALYEAIELPLYNMYLGIHTYLAMTGYVMPMPSELNKGLNTLGTSVSDLWAETVWALADTDGWLMPTTVAGDPSGNPVTGYPKDVVMDPPAFTAAVGTILADIVGVGAVEVKGEVPSEFTRPWRFPTTDNEGDAINLENPQNAAGPFPSGADANALFASSPGSAVARQQFEEALNEGMTIDAETGLLPTGKHLGDPLDYAAYLVATLTRDGLDLSKIANFNLDADRGYGYLTWDWVRSKDGTARPDSFKNISDPSTGGLTAASKHEYKVPVKPGYGWNESDQIAGTAVPGFNPDDPDAAVRIRYIDKEPKVI